MKCLRVFLLSFNSTWTNKNMLQVSAYLVHIVQFLKIKWLSVSYALLCCMFCILCRWWYVAQRLRLIKLLLKENQIKFYMIIKLYRKYNSFKLGAQWKTVVNDLHWKRLSKLFHFEIIFKTLLTNTFIWLHISIKNWVGELLLLFTNSFRFVIVK